MKVVTGPREFEQMVADYVLEQFPAMQAAVPGGRLRPYRAVAFMDGDVLHGGLLMTDYRGFDAQVSIYVDAPRFIGLQALRRLMDWTYNTVGLKRVTALIDPKNKASRRFAEKLGFQLEGKMRQGLDGEHDALIYGMLRKDARFLKDT